MGDAQKLPWGLVGAMGGALAAYLFLRPRRDAALEIIGALGSLDYQGALQIARRQGDVELRVQTERAVARFRQYFIGSGYAGKLGRRLLEVPPHAMPKNQPRRGSTASVVEKFVSPTLVHWRGHSIVCDKSVAEAIEGAEKQLDSFIRKLGYTHASD